MKLSDAVTYVQIGDGRIGPEQFQTLECSVSITLTDACDPDQTSVLVQGGGLGVYDSAPFAIQASMELSTRCAPNDFDRFLRAAVEQAVDFGVARALSREPQPGSISAGQVWIGSDGAEAIDYTGDAFRADGAGFADAVAEARTLWHTRVAGAEPVLHVSPRALPGLGRATMLAGDPDDRVTCWGDPVVHDVGYDPLPGTPRNAAAPIAFWAPRGFQVQRGAVQDAGMDIGRWSENTRVYVTDVPVKVAVSPCSIVRVDATAA